jgi:hypothetical protein
MWIKLGAHGDGLWMAGGQPVPIPFLRSRVASIYPNRLIEGLDFSCFGYESSLGLPIHRFSVSFRDKCKNLFKTYIPYWLYSL